MIQGNACLLLETDDRRQEQFLDLLKAAPRQTLPVCCVENALELASPSSVLFANDDTDLLEHLTNRLTEQGRWLPIVGYATEAVPERIVRAVQSGVSEYLTWPLSSERLWDLVLRSEWEVPAFYEAHIRKRAACERLKALSKREREVLAHIGAGRTNKLIARKLGISHRTVEIHRANMLGKLNNSSTTEAIRIACEAKLASED